MPTSFLISFKNLTVVRSLKCKADAFLFGLGYKRANIKPFVNLQGLTAIKVFDRVMNNTLPESLMELDSIFADH